MTLGFYSSDTAKLSDLYDVITEKNICGFDLTQSQKFYEYKIKHFLTDTALGMMPATVWSGNYEANGGYIIVKDKGDIVCFHIYKKKELEDYLFYNTKFETASTSRHEFGNVEKDISGLIMKLNMQIRFIK